MTTRSRPTSPHLQVYRLPMAAKMSITHRMTGVILVFGMVLITGWLVAAAMGEESYNTLMGWMRHPLGIAVLFGWSLAFYYHLCNGIRHLIWDTGRLFNLKAANMAGWAVLLATAGLQWATWCHAGGGVQ